MMQPPLVSCVSLALAKGLGLIIEEMGARKF